MRRALPEALGRLIEAPVPVMIAVGLNQDLQELLWTALDSLMSGVLPSDETFPFAPGCSGEPVDATLVQVLHHHWFVKVTQLMLYGQHVGKGLFHDQAPSWHRQVRLRALRQPDGGLNLVCELEQDRLGVRLPPGAWALVTTHELKRPRS